MNSTKTMSTGLSF